MTVSNLQSTEFIPYFKRYIDLAKGLELRPGLQKSLDEVMSFCKSLPESKYEYRYEAGKWNVKEIIAHLIDTERVFCYRALCFARQDKTELPGFDQDDYLANSNATNRKFEDLLEEYQSVRQASIGLFNSFTNDMLLSIGTASGGEASVRALGFLIIGHERHHINIIKERYLQH